MSDLSFPRWMFHKEKCVDGKIFNSAEEFSKAGSGWVHNPADFDKPLKQEKSDDSKSPKKEPKKEKPEGDESETSDEESDSEGSNEGEKLSDEELQKKSVKELKEVLIAKGLEAKQLNGLKKADLIELLKGK